MKVWLGDLSKFSFFWVIEGKLGGEHWKYKQGEVCYYEIPG